MARMPRGNRSPGRPHGRQRKVFRFLHDTARPDRDFIVVEPTIGSSGVERNSLFMGIPSALVLEVQDWEIIQIGEVTPHTFKFWTGNKEETRTNLDRQAKGYVNELMDLLKTPEFHQGTGTAWRAVENPGGPDGGVPPHKSQRLPGPGIEPVITLDRTLLAEDLEPAGELRADPSGEKFRARIAQAFPFPFNGLSGKEIQILIALIYPILKFEPPKRHGSCKDRFQREVEALDEDQSRAALSLKAGHQLLKGPPGSGKTLIGDVVSE